MPVEFNFYTLDEPSLLILAPPGESSVFILGEFHVLTRSDALLPRPSAYKVANRLMSNLDMAFSANIHVLKKTSGPSGGSTVQIVKYSKSYASASDIISTLDLQTSETYDTNILVGKLSVAQDANGKDQIAACISVMTEEQSSSPSPSPGPGGRRLPGPEPITYTYKVNFWSVSTENDSRVDGSYGLSTDDAGSPVDLTECVAVNAGTSGSNYALVRNKNNKLMLILANQSTQTTSTLEQTGTRTGFQTWMPPKVIFFDQGSKSD